MKIVALVGDKTNCPAYSGTTPHIAGLIQSGGQNKVFYQGKPLAVVSSPIQCLNPDFVAEGSNKMFIQKKAVARFGDKTAHKATLIATAVTLNIN